MAFKGGAQRDLRRVGQRPAGVDGGLIQATPPLTITDAEVEEALYALRA